MPRSFQLPAPSPLAEQRGQTLTKLVELMQRLLAPDGCPWDREQNLFTLRRFVVEEAAEVVDAIESEQPDELCEELGDLLLQIVFQAELARDKGWFGPDDVVYGICEKLVRRHPHVFGSSSAEGADEVLVNWERIKAEEKAGRGLLDGIPRNMPALQGAQQISQRAAQVGFDWSEASAAREKVNEEFHELDQELNHESPEAARVQEEFGDLMFALVSWGRHLGLDAEVTLRAASDKFRRRFGAVERSVQEQHGGWPQDKRGRPGPGLAPQLLDRYWNEAKASGK